VSERQSPGGDTSVKRVPTPEDKASRESDLRSDAEKRESLVQLRRQYLEAQKLVSSDEPYVNLEWILGSRRNITEDPLGLATRTIELVGLWLQDVALELDRRLPPAGGNRDAAALSPNAARELAARSLRDATERFLLAFRSPTQVGSVERPPSRS
jgi:hypothetical protein